MINTLKSKRENYCKITENPYSYWRYIEMYPNIKVKTNLKYWKDTYKNKITKKKIFEEMKKNWYKMSLSHFYLNKHYLLK